MRIFSGFVSCLGFCAACACSSGNGATGVDGGEDMDTGTGTGEDTPVWPPYEDAPDFTTADKGYATGSAWADIDGDGRLDLVVANGNDMLEGPLMVYLAQPDGSLPATASWQSGELAYYGHVAVGDVDGDGWTDVAVAEFIGESGFSEPGGVALYLNEGGALPAAPSWESSERFYCFSVALGDVDNDGDLDLAAAAGEPYAQVLEPDRLFLNQGGAFAEPAAWVASDPSLSSDVAFLDADGNGALDLVFARNGRPHAIYLNTGDVAAPGLPSTAPDWEAPGAGFEGNTVDFGDLNGDGHVDIVVSDNNQLGGAGRVTAFCGPSFDPCWRSEDPPTYQSAVALADLDGDGDLDLAAGSWWGPLRFYRNDTAPSGGLALETTPSAATDTSTVVETITFHDLDGSGAYERVVEAEGPLVELPRRCEVVSSDPPGAIGDGYLTAPGNGKVKVTCRLSRALDLLVTDWTFDHGNDLYVHRGRARADQ
ncbi:MAG: VCBS repeat-containing protein [Deltaproteobacteria bacterium]|nr:VCBS repeat-containing protein [Deltaproteobacteria bacterium]